MSPTLIPVGLHSQLISSKLTGLHFGKTEHFNYTATRYQLILNLGSEAVLMWVKVSNFVGQ